MNTKKMFNLLANKYDLFNTLSSIGFDEYWRKIAVSKTGNAKKILDVCTGTGKLAFKLANKHIKRKIVGIDYSQEMLEIAKDRLNNENIEFELLDAEKLYFNDETFDCVTTAYAMRNVMSNINVVLKEMHRVLQKDGKIIILDITKPKPKILKFLYAIYLRSYVYLIGIILFGKIWPFKYLYNSIFNFYEPEELKSKLEKIGFKNVKYSSLTFGAVCIWTGIKQ